MRLFVTTCALLLVMVPACGSSSAGNTVPSGGRDSATRPGTSGEDGAPDGSGIPDDAGAASSSDDASSSPGALDGASDDASASNDASTIASNDGVASCVMTFPAVTDFGAAGPYDVAIDCSVPTTVTADGTGCAIYHPTTMGQGGLKHPVIVWGNGTASPPECNGTSHVFGEYDWLLNQWASQGFIVAAANTDSTGDGTDMLDCLGWVEQQNGVAGSVYEGVVDVGNDGASGHSQGGGSALNLGKDPRIQATIPIMPYTVGGGFSYDSTAPTKQHGPMFLGSGGMDTIATPSTNQQPVFDMTTTPTFWGTLLAADHVTFATGGQADWLAPTTAWFRLFLMCDQSARPMFYGSGCTLCSDAKWSVQRKNM